MDFSDIALSDISNLQADRIALEVIKKKMRSCMSDHNMLVIPKNITTSICVEPDIHELDKAARPIYVPEILTRLMAHTDELSVIQSPVVVVLDSNDHRYINYNYFKFTYRQGDVEEEFQKFKDVCKIISTGKVYCYDKANGTQTPPVIELRLDDNKVASARDAIIKQFFKLIATSPEMEQYNDVRIMWLPRIGRIILWYLSGDQSNEGSLSIWQVRRQISISTKYQQIFGIEP